jgi:phosphopantothenoylcysteine decarboxylase/phosphopantothenate--cysteine ligase
MSARVVLGVGAGIAAYKACELLRLLTESGHQVRVVPTPDALRFVGEVTWAALSGQPVTTDAWTGVADVPHVRLGQSADLVVVAPATADLMARAAAGMAGDLLTATLLTARCPVLYARAMHTEMWEHPATQANVALLRRRGAIVLPPATGRLTGQDSGAGRLPEPAAIFAAATRLLGRGPAAPDLAGRRVVVSAGGTREEIDPVRFIGNWSTGTQGYALARTAVARGAEVTVVAANVTLPDPAGVKVIRVVSARDMWDAVMAAAGDAPGDGTGDGPGDGPGDGRCADAVVMAAAVADYRPAERSPDKIKKDGRPMEPIALTENPDILAGLGSVRAVRDRAISAGHEAERAGLAPPFHPRQVLVGFAAETDTSPAGARAKLARKGCDLLVVNPVGDGLGFGTPDNEAVVYGSDGTVTRIPRGPKEGLADVVWDLVLARLP